MRYSISDTAEYGDMVAGPRVIGSESRTAMKELLREVQDGSFAKDWILENQTGRPRMKAWRRREVSQQLEQVGADLRDMMPWLEAKRPLDRARDGILPRRGSRDEVVLHRSGYIDKDPRELWH